MSGVVRHRRTSYQPEIWFAGRSRIFYHSRTRPTRCDGAREHRAKDLRGPRQHTRHQRHSRAVAARAVARARQRQDADQVGCAERLEITLARLRVPSRASSRQTGRARPSRSCRTKLSQWLGRFTPLGPGTGEDQGPQSRRMRVTGLQRPLRRQTQSAGYQGRRGQQPSDARDTSGG
jgi:hypothetical protein